MPIDLKKISTRNLLKMRNFTPCPEEFPEKQQFQNDLRAELNTREHVPTDKEAREARRHSTNKKKKMKYGR